MKKLYNLIFVITLLLIAGLITNVNAVSLSNSEGRITVTRQVTDVHNPVTNTFTYGVLANPVNPAPVTGLLSSFNIVFNRTNPVIEEGKWWGTATQTGTLDLTGINFTKVGDYTFLLWEQNSTNPSNYPIDESNRYRIVISVRNQVDSNNHPTGDLIASLAYIKNSRNSKVSDVEFSTSFYTADISIKKEVQGNMANADEYFKVQVNIDCQAGDTYQIAYYDILNNTYDVDRTISYNGSNVNRTPNSEVYNEGTEDEGTYYYATYTCGQTNYVYLKHGESVEVYGLLNGTEYSFTEQGATNYETYINGSSNNSKSSGTLSTLEIENISDRTCSAAFGSVCEDSFYSGGSGGGRSNIIGQSKKPKNMLKEVDDIPGGEDPPFNPHTSTCESDICPTFDYDVEDGENIILNVQTSQVPTGVILKYLPYAILVLVVAGSFVFFIIAKRRSKNS